MSNKEDMSIEEFGQELLQAIREMKEGKAARITYIQPAPDKRGTESEPPKKDEK
jgi:hypothetical protein